MGKSGHRINREQRWELRRNPPTESICEWEMIPNAAISPLYFASHHAKDGGVERYKASWQPRE